MADLRARTRRYKVYAEVEVPRVPNFLRTEATQLPLSAFTDDALREIGQDWTDNLIERAQKQREDAKGEADG